MIDRLQALLVERGYMAEGARAPSNTSFRRPNFIQLFPDAHRSVVAKTAAEKTPTAEALAREYATLRSLAPRHVDLIAAPVAFEVRDGHALLVMEGVAHGPTALADLMRPLPGAETFGRFLGRVETLESTRSDIPAPLHLEPALMGLPDGLKEKVSALAGARNWRGWEDSLPAGPQHSDLAINNVGLKSTGFVLFDWEDYGRVTFPGFDVAVLLVSACGFDARRVHATVKSLSHESKCRGGALPQAVNLLPTERERLREVVLISLVLFHSLKCTLNYDDDVIAKCRALLSALID